MNSKYDIFISYRREGGLLLTRCICYYLRSKGVRCFFDLKEIKGGRFDEKIYRALDDSKYFLLILTVGALDRCVNEDDWVRKEIEYAKAKSCEIVPLMIKGHEVIIPDDLPASIREIATIEREPIDVEKHFERDIEGILVNRMPRIGKKITGELLKNAKRRREEAEDAFCEQARQFKDVDRIRIDVGGGYQKLLRRAEDLDIEKSRAVILITEVNSSINQRRTREAWIKKHTFLLVVLVIATLLVLGVLVYSVLPSGWKEVVDDRILFPFMEHWGHFWDGMCRRFKIYFSVVFRFSVAGNPLI